MQPSNRRPVTVAACLVLLGSCGAAQAQGAAPSPVPAASGIVWTTSEPIGPAAMTEAPAVQAAAPIERRPGDTFEVVPLRYADVSEVAGLLTANQALKPNDGFSPQEPAFGSAAFQGGGYFGSGVGASTLGVAYSQGPSLEPLGQSVDALVGIDRRLNAIVLRGDPEQVAALKAQIARLDVAVDSVVLETVFVELTQTGARNVGLDFANPSGQLATAAYSFSTGDFPGLANTARFGGVTANLQAAIYAQIAKGNGRIVSRPRISAQSGQSAKIITGDALPILTSIAVSGVNAVQQEVQYVNVGVTLQIAPRVSDDGFVTSHVFAVVSSVTGFSQGYPTISQREASTSATVRDGESFVIGGLTQESSLARQTRLPGIGQAPLIGQLLSLQNTSRTKTELYIMVTPRIVRTHAPQPAPPPPDVAPAP